MHKTSPEKPKSKKKSINPLQYAGMAFQMGLIIFLGTLGGKELDEKLSTERPYFTVLGALVGLVVAFYLTLKDLIIQK